MTDAPAILLIDSNSSDRTLSALLLRRDLPRASITAVSGAMDLADALAGPAPDAVVIACDAVWAETPELIALVKRRAPSAAVIVFGREAEVLARIGSGLACDGIVPKSSAGFLVLASIVMEALARRGHRPLASPSPPPRAPAAPSVPEPAVAATPLAPPDSANRTDQELREIALVFSHDLREPVQQIERLARRGQTSDDGPSAANALQHVLRSSERVNRMLDDMVEYLSVTGRSVSSAEVDLNACLKQAMANLRTVIEETHAQIRAPQLPPTSGDHSQLVHLFQNLLSNAIKFRGARPPVVTITCEPQGNQWLIGFHDNGIGIPSEFTERIFELGRRLHTREEYPGSGIGLALCRRIVERHGGRIWAESRNADGSTFYVVLPRSREEAVSDSLPAAVAASPAREERS